MNPAPGTIWEDADGVQWFLGDLGWYQLPITDDSWPMDAPPMREPVHSIQDGWRP